MSRTGAVLLIWVAVTILSATQMYITSAEAYVAAQTQRVAQPAPEAIPLVCHGMARALLESEAPLTQDERELVRRVLTDAEGAPSADDLAALKDLWQLHCGR